jgi:hypothetical protein
MRSLTVWLAESLVTWRLLARAVRVLDRWKESDIHSRDCQRTIAESPNFWHKTSGLKVHWYKYIGRDNEIEIGREVSLHDLLDECLRSIGAESVDAAIREYAEAEREAAEAHNKAMEFWMSDTNGENEV